MPVRPAAFLCLLLALLVATASPLSGKGCGIRERVKLENLPEAVRLTIEKNLGEGKLLLIEKRTRRGSSTYSAEIKRPDGLIREVEVSESGELLSIEISKPDDD